MNNESKIKKLIKCRFNFLCKELGATIVKEKTSRFGVFISYKTEMAGIRVSFEPREGGVFVMIFPLIDNEIPPYRNWHDIEDLLTAKNVRFNKLTLDDNFNPNLEELNKILINYANYVQSYAYDFLKGDLSVLDELKVIVKKRIEDLR